MLRVIFAQTSEPLAIAENVDRTAITLEPQAFYLGNAHWGDNGYLLDNLPENPLPDSYTVYVRDKDAANTVASSAPGIEGVDDVVYYRDTIEKLA
jgi:cell division transport system permease protein